MPNVLSEENSRELLARLADAHDRFAAAYPGDRSDRQPVHTVYGGAHLFSADISSKLGAAALRALRAYAPSAERFAHALALPGAQLLPSPEEEGSVVKQATEADPAETHAARQAAQFAQTVYDRVTEKLAREPIEDYRIDFEDGYGNRSNAEEDGHAEAAAREAANGARAGTLPPFVGIRIKPLTRELAPRALRTLDLFLSTMLVETGGLLPPGFVITLPKVTDGDQVAMLVDALEALERAHGLFPGSLRLELMIETPQAVVAHDGHLGIQALVAAARGRCRGAHFGTYDYTAGCGITAAHQLHFHRACDFARHVMQVSLAGTGVTLSDGATTLIPVGPHREEPGGPALTPEQQVENRVAVHGAWKAHYDDVRRSLAHGYYQGWDLNPAQLPTRYAAVYAFFLEGRSEAGERLRAFVERAAQATLLGNVFDDAATGQGLLNFFLRGLGCGALTEHEALESGLSLEELRGRSFVKILAARSRGNG